MDWFGASLDVLFLMLALLLIPSSSDIPLNPDSTKGPTEQTRQSHSAPTSPAPSQSKDQYLSPPVPSGHSTPSQSPLVSPTPSTLAVPCITLTPEHSTATNRPSHRPAHQRKSVSFSLSSMDELQPKQSEQNRKRPPTPFVSGPVSPAASNIASNEASPAPSMPGTPADMSHNLHTVDPMGVQKSWLMP
ncbi:hypothetical protein DB88DRAFT_300833 [Papiliotrema laurentii]|uniref:Uncharacterized protein n=1 Tax=Papiliotrema laurentii TaxID=5418 RepID=A0AAD9CZZ9_PAPLA|nr:hypothetical protein DB88DRAFT_300833 [Papiliotrema laurentii]